MPTPRRLVLMRHAKSSWDAGVSSDHARPLNGRGRRDAPRMGRWLAEHDWVPDLAVMSDSARTTETWSRLRGALPWLPAEHATPLLYHAGLDALRAHAAQWAPHVGTVLALGHNPGWEDAVSDLTGIGTRLTTANLALLEGVGERWSDALAGPWRLVQVVRPRELEATDLT
jgi:phosphohistidine phosphatase